MMDHRSFRPRSLEQIQETKTPLRAEVVYDDLAEAWTYKCFSGNRVVDRGPDFSSPAKAEYGMRQRFAGYNVKLWNVFS